MTGDAKANGRGEGEANGKEEATGGSDGGADQSSSSAATTTTTETATATSADTANGNVQTNGGGDTGKGGRRPIAAVAAREAPSPSPSSSSSSSSSSSLSTLACVVIAAISFSVGVLTPPLLEIYEDRLPTQARTLVARYLGGNGSSKERTNVGIDGGGNPTASSGGDGDGDGDGDSRRGSGRRRGSSVPCTPENLARFLHDEPVSGLHVACVTRDGGGGGVDGDGDGASLLSVALHRGACSTPRGDGGTEDDDGGGGGGGAGKGACSPPETVSVEYKWPALRDTFVDSLDLESPPNGKREKMKRWQMYTPDGVLIAGAEEHGNDSLVRRTEILRGVVDSEMVIIVRGGTWIWPGVRIGFERTISLSGSIMAGRGGAGGGGGGGNATDGLFATLRTLSLKPLVLSVSEFLTTDECDYIQEEATPHMQYSGVSLKDADKGKKASEWRTSQTYFMRAREHEKLRRLDDRVATLTRIPRRHQEDIQVLRYGYEEKYDQHHDFFDPSHYANSPDILRLIQNGERNRLATVFWYLSDVEEGGETIFPREGGVVRRVSFSDCTVGLKVRPEKRKVIIFYSMRHDGELDDYSLHGACPVKKGIKWAANKWVWSAPMDFVS